MSSCVQLQRDLEYFALICVDLKPFFDFIDVQI